MFVCLFVFGCAICLYFRLWVCNIDNQAIETVSRFTYLGSDIDSDGYSYPEIHFSGGFVQCNGKHRIAENLNRVSLTGRQTSCHDIACAMHTRRAVKIAIFTYSGLHFLFPGDALAIMT